MSENDVQNAKKTDQEELIIEALYLHRKFNATFREFAKKVAEDFGWSRQKLEYHLKKLDEQEEEEDWTVNSI